MKTAQTIQDKSIRTICIIGAGNEGHYLMALIGANPEISVNVLTSNSNNFNSYIESTNVNTGETTKGKVTKVSTNPEDVIPESDMILFTVPHNACGLYLNKIYSYVKPETFIGFIPGTGGVEFLAKDFILKKKCIVFGSQRVPSGTKLIERGAKVNSLGNRKDIRIASTNPGYTVPICNFISDILSIQTIPLPNYLSVTFTPSNPILHTSRIYGLFHNYKEGDFWDKHLAFYSNWDDNSSSILIECDNELQECCKKMDKFDLSGVISLKTHYEINTMEGESDVQRMTKKIRSLKYLKDYAPMCKDVNNHYIPDFSTRYFLEDFPYGLCIIKDFIKIVGGNSSMIDTILKWYDSLMDTKYYTNNSWNGEGLEKLPLPRNYGLNTLNEIYKYYDSISGIK